MDNEFQVYTHENTSSLFYRKEEVYNLQKRKKKSHSWDLNPRPTHYECVALPLS